MKFDKFLSCSNVVSLFKILTCVTTQSSTFLRYCLIYFELVPGRIASHESYCGTFSFFNFFFFMLCSVILLFPVCDCNYNNCSIHEGRLLSSIFRKTRFFDFIIKSRCELNLNSKNVCHSKFVVPLQLA